MTNGSTRRDAPLPEVRRSLAPLREQVQAQLREAIIDGRLAPGARLIERELIDMLGVSRTVVREALRQLQAEGLVGEDARKGMIVRALTLAEAQDLYAIRAVLEGLAARLFVQHGTADERSALADALKATVSAYEGGDPHEVLTAKNDFYRCLFDGARSDTLTTMLGMLHARIWRWRALGLGHPDRSAARSRESVKALKSLLAAIRAGDGVRAEQVMREETERAASEVMRLLKRPGEAAGRTPGRAARARPKDAAERAA